MATPSQKGLQAAVVPGSPQDPNSMDARASRALGGQAAELAYEFDGQQGRPGVADIVNPLWAPLVDALNGTGYGATPAGAMTVKGSVGQTLPALGSPEDTSAPGYSAQADPTSVSYDPRVAAQHLAGLSVAKTKPLSNG